MNTIPPFEEFAKIARLSREIVITEKIDGTNAQILIADDQQPFMATEPGGNPVPLAFLCGSRTRWIYPWDDNHGFARWAYSNQKSLMGLGPGRHFGEWWGSGIQRGYGLQKGDKRFSLFNTGRWVNPGSVPNEKQSVCPDCCSVVPVLYQGNFDEFRINDRLQFLKEHGSVVSLGFPKPEGIVIYHTAANLYFKKTIEKDDVPKSLATA